jgi:DNA-binding transcriptional MerR regulator
VDDDVHISEGARRLGVTPHYLRMLEREGRIPQARRDYNGRVYSESDLALLKALGVRARPLRLKRVEDVLGARP